MSLYVDDVYETEVDLRADGRTYFIGTNILVRDWYEVRGYEVTWDGSVRVYSPPPTPPPSGGDTGGGSGGDPGSGDPGGGDTGDSGGDTGGSSGGDSGGSSGNDNPPPPPPPPPSPPPPPPTPAEKHAQYNQAVSAPKPVAKKSNLTTLAPKPTPMVASRQKTEVYKKPSMALQATSMVVSSIPVVGAAYNLASAVMGKDLITGRRWEKQNEQ